MLTFLGLSSCAGPGYYYQAASGHLKLMKARRDIDGIVANAETDPALAKSLQSAQELLQFAEKELKLPAGDSYQTYVETGRPAVTWNVVATPEFSLAPKKWCFPVAGCVPYRGYFDQEKAEEFADKLQAKGLDVAVTPVTAYSTLGWFDDPLIDTMMRGAETRLAATLFHELAHQKLYLKGDTAFNESYASFVEHAGVRAWLKNNGDPGLSTDRARLHRARADFNRLLGDTRKRLAALYATNKPGARTREAKAEIFAEMNANYRHMNEEQWAGRDYYRNWFHMGLNNAWLALFASYEGGMCAFTELFKEAGEDMYQFHRLAVERSLLPEPERREWLDQRCPDIASGSDL